MSPGSGYLQGGRRRRTRLTLPLLAVTILAVAAAGVLLAGGVGRGGGRTHRLGGAAPAIKSRPAPPPARGRRVSTYATVAEPAGLRVNVTFKHPPRSALLFDIRTGRVLWARRPDAQLRIASLTKMMTALVVVEHAKPSAEVRITKQARREPGSKVGVLPKRKKVRLETLLYGLLLPSGNDAAVALAQHVGGSVPRFVRMMNSKARALGMRCTVFSSPDGFQDRGNHSCAPDLALLAHAVLAEPRLARIVRSRNAILRFPIKGRKLYLYNNNPLLRLRYPGADGVKTGYTDAAGRCLVATARRGRLHLGVVLLHSPDPPTQSRQLLNRGFKVLSRTR
jgi:serine-type D-Ala-D-Ala carboxypeptidase (penicillin-binding protein 5/6)